MTKQITILIFSLTLFITLPILAMEPIQHRIGSYMSGGHMSGNMAGHSGSMMHDMEGMPANDSGHGRVHQDIHDSTGQNTHMMDRNTAQKMMAEYMNNVSPGMYHLKNLEDKGSTYSTDVYTHQGILMGKLSIDKKTGNITSHMGE